MHPYPALKRKDQATREGVLSTLPFAFLMRRALHPADYAIVHLHGRAKRDYLSHARFGRC
jgi:hypothetical protein